MRRRGSVDRAEGGNLPGEVGGSGGGLTQSRFAENPTCRQTNVRRAERFHANLLNSVLHSHRPSNCQEFVDEAMKDHQAATLSSVISSVCLSSSVTRVEFPRFCGYLIACGASRRWKDGVDA
jgi:hypothetical protein